jgi:D-amino peptidase
MKPPQSSASWLNYYMNDRRCGELAQVAAWAGMYNVPMLFVTGDQAACDEARELLLF